MRFDQSVLVWGDLVVVQQITKDLPSNAIDKKKESFANWHTMEEQCGVSALPDFGSMALACRGQCTCLRCLAETLNTEKYELISLQRSKFQKSMPYYSQDLLRVKLLMTGLCTATTMTEKKLLFFLCI